MLFSTHQESLHETGEDELTHRHRFDILGSNSSEWNSFLSKWKDTSKYIVDSFLYGVKGHSLDASL